MCNGSQSLNKLLPKTVRGVLEASTSYLSDKRIDNPRVVSELLISRLLSCKRLDLYLKNDIIMGDKHIVAMRRGIKRIVAGEPVQYVSGRADFMGRSFKVDHRCLIPRPETEVLVTSVLQYEPLWIRRKPIIVDLGTGSGCIIITLAIEKHDALYIAIDVSEEALDLARENVVDFDLEKNIILTSMDLSDFIEPGTVDVLVSNPPYITTAEYEKLPVHIREHEPRIALDGGENGLFVIENIIQDAEIILKPGGFLFMEIDGRQGGKVISMLEVIGFENIKIIKDMTGKDRVVSGMLK